MEIELEVKHIDGDLVILVDTGIQLEGVQLTPLGEHRFRMVGGSNPGDTAVFEISGADRARRLHLGPYLFHREETATG